MRQKAKIRETGEIGVLETFEPVIFESAIRPWDVLVDVRRTHAFRYRIQHLRLPGLVLYRDCYGSESRVQGMSPPNALTIGVPINSGNGSRLWNVAIGQGCVYSALTTSFDAHFSAGQQHLVAVIDLSHARNIKNIVNRVNVSSQPIALPQARQTIQGCSSFLQHILELVSRNPEVLERSSLQKAITDDLSMCIAHLAGYSEDMRAPNKGSAVRFALDRAVEYLHKVDPLCSTVNELCAGAGLHVRTLERAMRANFDCTTREFLRRRRFHIARRMLLAANPRTTSVTSIAFDLGFYDLGRFARDYFHLFGEKPSQTIRYPSVKLPSYVRCFEDLRHVRTR